MSMLSATLRFVRNREVVARQIEGELVIVPIRRGVGDLNSLYTLNQVGSVLWNFMNEGHTIEEMVSRVCDEFEVTATQAQSDIQNFLDAMLEEKLVQPLAEASTRALTGFWCSEVKVQGLDRGTLGSNGHLRRFFEPGPQTAAGAPRSDGGVHRSFAPLPTRMPALLQQFADERHRGAASGNDVR